MANDPNSSGMMTTKQVADRLGLKRHQFVHLIESGKITDCVHRLSNRRAFTEDEVREIEQYLATRKEKTDAVVQGKVA